jgi:hypothetical protein
MAYESIGAGGLGWSEVPWLGVPGTSHRIGVCGGERVSRQVCFVDNDPLEQATAERSGCVRSHRPWYQSASVTECRTIPAGNPGHIWCCPDNAPQPIPTTPEQRARDTELLLAEQQAAQEGRLTQTSAPTEIQKEPTIEIGRTQPVTQQETLSSTLSKIGRNPAWIVAAAVLGVGGYLGYRYFAHARPRARRTAALARVR